MDIFFGVDVGASKTLGVIADARGEVLGVGRAGGGNHQGVGYEGLTAALLTVFGEACAQADVVPGQIRGAGFGVGGYDWPSDRPGHLKSISALGLACPVEVFNDAVIGLIAGTSQGWGVNVTAGSSNNCRGRDREGREGRVVGNGMLFGELGGAYEIVVKSLQQVNYAWIQRQPPTALTGVFLDASGAADVMDLMERVSNDVYRLDPSLAVEVFRVAAGGDEAAREVIHWAGEELGWLAVSVIRQLGLEDEVVEVVQSGSVFEGGALICEPMEAVVLQHAPKAKIVRLDAPPVTGALLLAMEVAGMDGSAVREALIRNVKAVV